MAFQYLAITATFLVAYLFYKDNIDEKVSDIKSDINSNVEDNFESEGSLTYEEFRKALDYEKRFSRVEYIGKAFDAGLLLVIVSSLGIFVNSFLDTGYRNFLVAILVASIVLLIIAGFLIHSMSD